MLPLDIWFAIRIDCIIISTHCFQQLILLISISMDMRDNGVFKFD